MKKTILITFILLLPATVCAQDHVKEWELFGSLGGSAVFDDEGKIGSGLDVGGGISYRITPKLAIEGQFNRIAFERDFGGFSPVRFKGRNLFGTASLVYHFRTAQVQPYVLAGGGFVNHEFSVELPPFPSFVERGSNGGAVNVGTGVKVFVNQSVSIRPEFRLLVGFPNDFGLAPPISEWRGSVAVGFHW